MTKIIIATQGVSIFTLPTHGNQLRKLSSQRLCQGVQLNLSASCVNASGKLHYLVNQFALNAIATYTLARSHQDKGTSTVHFILPFIFNGQPKNEHRLILFLTFDSQDLNS